MLRDVPLRLRWVLCTFLLIPGLFIGCGNDSSSTGTETAGTGAASAATAQTASLHLLETGSTLLVQALLQQLDLPEDDALSSLTLRPAGLAIACPSGGPDADHCEEGSVSLGFESCSLNEIGGSPFFLSKLSGQFLACGRDGLNLSGDLSADTELQLKDDCDLTGPLSSCRPSHARLSHLAGLLDVTDENGAAWEAQVLDGFFTADWPEGGTDFFHAQISQGELDLKTGGGRFRCVIHEGEMDCVPDADGDGAADAVDNCPSVANADQQDVDGDGFGDACDEADVPCNVPPTCATTDDCHGFLDACPKIGERLDALGDDLACIEGACKVFIKDRSGDSCSSGDPVNPAHSACTAGTCGEDTDCSSPFGPSTCFQGCCRAESEIASLESDDDGDGVINLNDNCPDAVNPTQGDCDRDGIGDACDNCAVDFNPDQADSENEEFAGDGIGDVCDPDDDDDGIPDTEDLCPHNRIRSTTDTDGDGIPDICDNCPTIPNPDQADSDSPGPGAGGDGAGDVCDVCPDLYDPPQTDTDGDGIGDECDSDRDGDGVPNDVDDCPFNYDPDQLGCNSGPPIPIGPPPGP